MSTFTPDAPTTQAVSNAPDQTAARSNPAIEYAIARAEEAIERRKATAAPKVEAAAPRSVESTPDTDTPQRKAPAWLDDVAGAWRAEADALDEDHAERTAPVEQEPELDLEALREAAQSLVAKMPPKMAEKYKGKTYEGTISDGFQTFLEDAYADLVEHATAQGRREAARAAREAAELARKQDRSDRARKAAAERKQKPLDEFREASERGDMAAMTKALERLAPDEWKSMRPKMLQKGMMSESYRGSARMGQ